MLKAAALKAAMLKAAVAAHSAFPVLSTWFICTHLVLVVAHFVLSFHSTLAPPYVRISSVWVAYLFGQSLSTRGYFGMSCPRASEQGSSVPQPPSYPTDRFRLVQLAAKVWRQYHRGYSELGKTQGPITCWS
ncbi:hypothetical protein C8R45DRAFT_942074 [Mycena sanguinolenta]|nr:hypothetical protein C8R45DRAFT_942074 [Mycena sanguinolenta]